MNHHEIPLLEHDPSRDAIIQPWAPRAGVTLPPRAVACWFADVVKDRTRDTPAAFSIALEREDHHVHVLEHRGVEVAVFFPGVGAPLAAASLELVIAAGARHVIGCGGAGIVVGGFDPGHVILPVDAVRDEGTSYHYLPAGAPARPHDDAVAAIDQALAARGIPHDRGRTWTTDAFFRETPARVARRREQGCLTVEMEAAAMFAVAAHREVVYGQLLYAGDDVSAESWDHRHWNTNTSARDRLLDLALDAVVTLGD